MGRLVESRAILWVSAAIVAAAHAAVLFGWSSPPVAHGLLLDAESTGVEVELAASPEQDSEEIAAPADEPPAPEPFEQPSPEPTPLPEEPPPVEEKPEFWPEAQALPTPAPTPAPRRAAQNPTIPKQNQSATPPAAKPGARAQAGGSTGSGSPHAKASQAAFAKRPSLIYPVESRQAREEGTVVLRITVDSQGRPTHVVVVKGSGFLRLDRAAIEGAWRCRIRNAKAGMVLDVPLRFDLDE
jgi:protein TonB